MYRATEKEKAELQAMAEKQLLKKHQRKPKGKITKK